MSSFSFLYTFSNASLESSYLPLTKYLESNGVKIEYGIDVKNVIFENSGNKKQATKIIYEERTVLLLLYRFRWLLWSI